MRAGGTDEPNQPDATGPLVTTLAFERLDMSRD